MDPDRTESTTLETTWARSASFEKIAPKAGVPRRRARRGSTGIVQPEKDDSALSRSRCSAAWRPPAGRARRDEGLDHRGFPAPAAAAQRLDGADARANAASAATASPSARSAAPGRPASARGPGRAQRLAEAHDGRGIAVDEVREPGAVVRVHRELRRIELSHARRDLAIEFEQRLRGIAARQPDEAEQPVQALRRIALLQVRLAILDDRAFAQRGLGAIEHSRARCAPSPPRSARTENPGTARRPRHRLQPFVAPGGVREPELVAPVARFERHRAPRARPAPRPNGRR